MPRIAVLIVAAGSGERAGRGAAQAISCRWRGMPMLRRAIEAFAGHAACSVQVVIGPGQEAHYAPPLPDLTCCRR